MNRRKVFVSLFVSAFLVLGIAGTGSCYLLSSGYVLKRMIQNYRSIRSMTFRQRIEAYGEDATFPFASVDEKVKLEPIVPMKIWIGGKLVLSGGEMAPEIDVNPYLLEAQRRYGFYKDVFLTHQVNLVTSLLERLGIAPVEDRLRLLYPDVAYQVGNELTHENLKGLWIDKDRFIPLRIVGTLTVDRNETPTQETIDIRYGDYRLVNERYWIPFDIRFYVEGKLSLRIRVVTVSVETY